MELFFKPWVLLHSTTECKTIPNSDRWSTQNKFNSDSSRIVGVFSHHRDVKVALEELTEAGFPSSLITLIARNCQRYSWLPTVNTNEYFDEKTFSFNRVAREFFQRLFQRGKFLLLITGDEQDLSYASSIIGRRRGHSEVWHL